MIKQNLVNLLEEPNPVVQPRRLIEQVQVLLLRGECLDSTGLNSDQGRTSFLAWIDHKRNAQHNRIQGFRLTSFFTIFFGN